MGLDWLAGQKGLSIAIAIRRPGGFGGQGPVSPIAGDGARRRPGGGVHACRARPGGARRCARDARRRSGRLMPDAGGVHARRAGPGPPAGVSSKDRHCYGSLLLV